MEFTIYSKLTGEIVRYGMAQDEFIYLQCMNDDEGLIIGHYDDDTYYIEDGEPVAKGPSPGQNYYWSVASKTWIGDIVTAKKHIKSLIDAERDRLDSEIIVYDDKRIDADRAAKDAIIQKISELRAAADASETPNHLMWRDADNVTHSWVLLIVYKLWLYRLLIAISKRSTLLRMYGWAHKDAVDALTTVEDIESYNTIRGWSLMLDPGLITNTNTFYNATVANV